MIEFVLLGLLLTLTTKTSVLAVMAQIDAGGYNTVGLKSDGTAKAVGDNRYGQRDVDSWTDIVQVTVGAGHTVGLKSDGTLRAAGLCMAGRCDVDSWTDIIQVSAGWIHTIGLKSNGSVITAGCGGWNYGQCDVSDWKLIVTGKSLF